MVMPLISVETGIVHVGLCHLQLPAGGCKHDAGVGIWKGMPRCMRMSSNRVCVFVSILCVCVGERERGCMCDFECVHA